jgi:eukaryotic-like serine/threonine-protein kinase
MTLAPGTRLGPYEVTGPCAAGGMGEVYRARDTLLGRDLALKVLPSDLAHDASRRARFEQEARAASALNHPHIVTVHAIGSEDGLLYMAMELVDGPTLREVIAGSPLPTRKLLSLAAQVADGLARAHAAGIVHRDLKPDNVMVSRDGYAKILDFGLAKLAPLPGSDAASETPTRTAPETHPGTVLGTVGYMSPEQASGRPVDFRSDQFSLGAILYEMATGQRAFKRDTAAETLTAIIREEPEPIDRRNPSAPPPLRWVVERCLAKDPDDRYASTRDLARDLQGLRDRLSETTLPVSPARARRPWLAAAMAAAAGVAAAAFLAGRGAAPPPSFERLTFRRGNVTQARLAPDGHTVLYAAAWEGEPTRIHTARLGRPESSPLALPDADLLAVSSTGELAISLQSRFVGSFISKGVLARVPLAGGAPREVLRDVEAADWSPDGSALAVVHEVAGKSVLELPIGTRLVESAGWLANPRVSPAGDRVAFLDHPVRGDNGGAVAVVDAAGNKTTLSSGWKTLLGLAWAPGGREIWFTGARAGAAAMLHAVSLSGRERLVATAPGGMALQDVGPDGRGLLSVTDFRIGLRARLPGDTQDRELSWLDWSLLRDMSADGRLLLFEESGEGGGQRYGAYVRSTDGSPAVRLGDGGALALSPDGAWVLARTEGGLSLLPTGAGAGKPVYRGPLVTIAATFLPDGRSALLRAQEPNAGLRLWVLPLDGGAPRAITPEGIPGRTAAPTPDGRAVLALGPDGQFRLYPVDGGEPRAFPSLGSTDWPIRWSADGRALYVYPRTGPPWVVRRLDVATGRQETVYELVPAGRAGFLGIFGPQVTPDGATVAYSYAEGLATLYAVQGLR